MSAKRVRHLKRPRQKQQDKPYPGPPPRPAASPTHKLDDDNQGAEDHKERRDDAHPRSRRSRHNVPAAVLVKVGVTVCSRHAK